MTESLHLQTLPRVDQGRPTLKTIALETGFAIATVSRALKDAPDIGEDTKRLVRAVAIRLGYRPNRAGVRLRTGKTNVIALVLSTEQDVMNHTSRLIYSIAAALRGTALGVTAYQGDTAFLATLQSTLEKAKTPLVRAAVISALGDFHDPALASQALAYSLTPALNSTEFLTVVFSMSGNPEMRTQATNWTIDHYDAIAAKAPAEYLARLINVAAAAEPEVFNRLRDFLSAPARKTAFAEVNIRKSSERLDLRQRLRAKEQANIAKFLSSFPGHTPKD